MSEPTLLERAPLAPTLDEDALHNALVKATFIEATDQALVFDLGEARKAHVAREELPGELPFAAGQEVSILVEQPMANAWSASYTKARKLQTWEWLEHLAKSGEVVEGTITGENKGGLSVDIGLRAFLPRSHVDLHRVNDMTPYIGRRAEFQVVEFDKKRGNVVVSRKALLERERKAERKSLIEDLAEGQRFTGTVRNITHFGAFIDIGGIDGLLHVTNMSWGRIDHPSELLRPGDEVEVVVLSWDPAKKRLGLGRKQLLADPWEKIDERYSEGQTLEGEVVSLADFGAFVALEPGLEGLVHVTELSWTERINHPQDVLKLGQKIAVKLLSIDSENRRLSLSVKALSENPWNAVVERYPVGSVQKGPIKNITDFGLFVELEEGVEGLVHVSDLSWTEKIENPREHFEVGQEVEVKVLDADADNQRIGLGIKQLTSDPWEQAAETIKPGQKVDVVITRLTDFGAFAEIIPGVEGLIHISELSNDRVNSASEVVRPGQQVNALVMSFERANQRIGLSLKRDELEDESSNLREYSDEDASAATLGDILRDRLGLAASTDDKADEPTASAPDSDEAAPEPDAVKTTDDVVETTDEVVETTDEVVATTDEVVETSDDVVRGDDDAADGQGSEEETKTEQ
ncbi:30S ribosomal protein S1 [Lujinxingia vulgaris]|uniref:Small ribosomal subunit protein bS1 n=1 Tax=Lujinxingia vulgaris TaxID=2600176 RepID=A0A5C6XBE5_9DELT|nr:30S ribosomal protein S1 [Lujinxingia vulgaris]TXD34668.1 30S ribosomal protein S1 [Lujinxingia vulgaris]